MIDAKIIDVGRGPQIAGSRITVFDVLDYLEEGWRPTQIALFFRLSTRQVEAAVRYIEEHKDDVREAYEVRESRVWLLMYAKCKLLPPARLVPLTDECTQLMKIIGKSLVTAKNNVAQSPARPTHPRT
jgi:uncharacterized protein (DUF433 family)